MSDNYQAVYDAVRSRFNGCDVENTVRQAISSAFFTGNLVHSVIREFELAAHEMQRPFVLFKPPISIDGNQWCVLYGENLQSGVSGFGDTPEKAALDFDKNWRNEKPKGQAVKEINL